MPNVKFEVLDTNNLRVNFSIPEASKKYLGGRRIKFRLRDRERGDSDWYLIKQTFVRFPQIEAVKCDHSLASSQSSQSYNQPNSVNLLCQMSGIGLDYISQVSTDGGLSWSPQAPNSLQAQLLSDGTSLAMIPFLQNKKMLQIRLRDYPKAEGLFIDNFTYSNSIKVVKKPTSAQVQTGNNQSQMMNQPNGQINNQPLPNNQGQVNSATQNQPKKWQAG